MGPEILVAIAFLGGAIVVAGSAYAGWSARAAIAKAVETLQEARIEGFAEQLDRAAEIAKSQAAAGRAVVDAAERRAAHDADADPLGVRLLLGATDQGRDAEAPPAAGTAKLLSYAGDREGPVEDPYDVAYRAGEGSAAPTEEA